MRAGRSNAENDYLLRAGEGYMAARQAVSFRPRRGGSAGKKADESVVRAAAEICAYFSAGRQGTKIDVDYTEKKNVKKPPKSPLGFWIYSEFSTVTVDPDKHEEFLKVK